MLQSLRRFQWRRVLVEATRVPQQRKYISLQAAADYLDVSVATVRRLISTGVAPGYRLGRRIIRVDMKDIDAAMRRIPAARSWD